jgi:hypothetical protein
MLVYNVTIKIFPAIETPWLHWLQQEHAPEVMACGQFTDWKLFRLLEQDEEDGITYVVQYFIDKSENYERYLQEYAPLMRQKSIDKWGNQFIAFRTVMEVVH